MVFFYTGCYGLAPLNGQFVPKLVAGGVDTRRPLASAIGFVNSTHFDLRYK